MLILAPLDSLPQVQRSDGAGSSTAGSSARAAHAHTLAIKAAESGPQYVRAPTDNEPQYMCIPTDNEPQYMCVPTDNEPQYVCVAARDKEPQYVCAPTGNERQHPEYFCMPLLLCTYDVTPLPSVHPERYRRVVETVESPLADATVMIPVNLCDESGTISDTRSF